MDQGPFGVVQFGGGFLPAFDNLAWHADEADVVDAAADFEGLFLLGGRSQPAAMVWHKAATRRAWMPRVG